MSATVLTGQAPTNLGPLTTTLTPPAACTVAIGARRGFIGDKDDHVAYRGQLCSDNKAVDDTACWPPTSKGAQERSAPLSGWGFYSPGVHCPVGYATACSATGGKGGGSGWPVQFKLRDGETAVGCCPKLVTFLRGRIAPLTSPPAGMAAPTSTARHAQWWPQPPCQP